MGQKRRRGKKKITANKGNQRVKREESKRANKRAKSVEKEKDKVEAVETRGEDGCERRQDEKLGVEGVDSCRE